MCTVDDTDKRKYCIMRKKLKTIFDKAAHTGAGLAILGGIVLHLMIYRRKNTNGTNT